MLIVAVDTSGRQGSVSLCRGDGTHVDVLELSSLEGGMYSTQLMPAISGALQQHGFSKNQVEGFVVVSGPGSFTGLRVGLSTVKALCEVLQKPLAEVSMLQALALTHGKSGETITALLDAGRGEVFAGEYRVSQDSSEKLHEYIIKTEGLAAKIQNSSRIVTPDAKIAEALQVDSGFTLVESLHADAVGRIGLRKLLQGDTVDPATLDANYIRRSDAELFGPKR